MRPLSLLKISRYLLIAFSISLATYLEFVAFKEFLNGDFIKALSLHAMGSVILGVVLLVDRFILNSLQRPYYLMAWVVWCLSPCLGSILAVIVFIHGVLSQASISNLHDYLFQNAHSKVELSFVDRLSTLVRRINSLLKPPLLAQKILDLPGNNSAKVAVLNEFDQISDPEIARICRLAQQDELFEIKVYGHKKLAEAEERRMDTIKTLLRLQSLSPFDEALAKEALFQVVVFHRSNVTNEMVSKLWVEKVLEAAKSIVTRDAAFYVLLGRCSLILDRFEDAKTYFMQAKELDPHNTSADFYRAEYYYRLGEYDLVRDILIDLVKAKREIPKVLTLQVKYWTAA